MKEVLRGIEEVYQAGIEMGVALKNPAGYEHPLVQRDRNDAEARRNRGQGIIMDAIIEDQEKQLAKAKEDIAMLEAILKKFESQEESKVTNILERLLGRIRINK